MAGNRAGLSSNDPPLSEVLRGEQALPDRVDVCPQRPVGYPLIAEDIDRHRQIALDEERPQAVDSDFPDSSMYHKVDVGVAPVLASGARSEQIDLGNLVNAFGQHRANRFELCVRNAVLIHVPHPWRVYSWQTDTSGIVHVELVP